MKEKEKVICTVCGCVIMDETINTIDGKTMCEHCFNEQTTICDHCGKRILREDAMGDSHYTLCQHCYDYSYTSCERCGTAEHYRSNVKNHIAPVFGNKKLKDIETSDISAFLTSLKCKPLTVNKIKIVFHSIMKYAVSQKYISENPCSGAVWYESTQKEYGKIENVLNLQQAQKLIELLDEYTTFNAIIKLLLLTGMRSGECLGLKWSSIDFDNKTIFIDKTLSYAGNEWFLSTPKTARSTRTIAIDDTAVELLKKHREEQNKQKEIVGAAWQHPEMVFTSCTGHWYDRSLLNTQFRRFMKKNKDILNLEHKFTIHGLRHTNAALLLFAGEDIENISAHLGHASSDITSRVYAHMYAEVKIRMAKTVSNALFK